MDFKDQTIAALRKQNGTLLRIISIGGIYVVLMTGVILVLLLRVNNIAEANVNRFQQQSVQSKNNAAVLGYFVSNIQDLRKAAGLPPSPLPQLKEVKP